jgi:O-succinylbenzoate synthase
LLDEFGLVMIEQPLSRRDLAGHATLQSMMRTPICLDESAEDITAVRQAIDLGSCRIINIKIQRVGGLKNAIAIHDICAKSDIPVWAGTMPELGIGSVQAVHLATMKNFTYPTDVESSRRWFADDIIQPLIEVAAGYIRIPAGTGICYHPDQGKIRSYTIRSHVW